MQVHKCWDNSSSSKCWGEASDLGDFSSWCLAVWEVVGGQDGGTGVLGKCRVALKQMALLLCPVYCFNLLSEGIFCYSALSLLKSIFFPSKVKVLRIKANISRCQWHPLRPLFLSKNLLLSSSFSPLDPETSSWGFSCFWKAVFPPATFKRLTLTFPWTYWQPKSLTNNFNAFSFKHNPPQILASNCHSKSKALPQ